MSESLTVAMPKIRLATPTGALVSTPLESRAGEMTKLENAAVALPDGADGLRDNLMPGRGEMDMSNTRLKVLLIEDDEDDYIITSRLLTQVEVARFQVDWIASFEEAIEVLGREHYDVYLIDYRLGSHNGLDVLRYAIEAGCQAPIIMLTGYGGHLTDMEAMRLGAADFLNKSDLTSALLERSIRYAIERKRSEHALQKNERRFRALIENSSDGITLLDAEGHITYASASNQRVLGRTADELLGFNMFQLVHADDRADVDARFATLLEAPGRCVSFQHRAQHKNGTWRWIGAVANNLLHDPDVQAIVVNYRDITVRMQTEIALLQAEEKYRSIFENAVEGIFQTTPDGHYLSANPALAQLLGYKSPAELMFALTDVEHQSYVNPQHRQEFIRAMQQQGSVEDFQTQVYRQDGSIIWISVKARIVRGEDGAVRHYEGSVEDITERKRAQEALQRAKEDLELRVVERTVALTESNERLRLELVEREKVEAALRESEERLRSLVDALREAKDEAERANRAKSEFLSRMSHELRTPLNAILGFTQLLQRRGLSPAQAGWTEHILKAGHHLLELINEVLDIARIEAGCMNVSVEPVSLRDITREALSLIKPLAAQHEIDINSTATDACPCYVMADRQRLNQVLLNILANAVKYNSHGGSISLACDSVAEGRQRLLITDTGPGIAADKMERVFLPFDRLGAEQSDISGTGLGLALAQRMTEAMGGTIGVESQPGQGSTFYIELPVGVDPLAKVARTALAGANMQDVEDMEATSQIPDTGIRTILYVEDNLPNLTLVEHLLSDRPEVRLITAMQGQLALDLARDHQPDLVLLDNHLPDLSGTEVLVQLKREETTRHIPIVVVSADATEHQVKKLMELGARAYLTKPLDVDKFFEALTDCVGEGRMFHD